MLSHEKGRWRQAGVACLLCGIVGALSAADLGVSPVRLSIGSEQRSTVVTFTNGGDRPATVQAQAMAWSTQGCESQLEPSAALVVSPPIFTVAPRSTQLVRVWPLPAARAAKESSFRILFTEIPTRSPEQEGALVRMRLSIPVFTRPPAPAAPKPLWQARRLGDGVEISARNDGKVHLRVENLSLTGIDGSTLGEQRTLSYVLPGDSCRWLIPMTTTPPERIRLTVAAGGGVQTLDLPVS